MFTYLCELSNGSSTEYRERNKADLFRKHPDVVYVDAIIRDTAFKYNPNERPMYGPYSR